MKKERQLRSFFFALYLAIRAISNKKPTISVGFLLKHAARRIYCLTGVAGINCPELTSVPRAWWSFLSDLATSGGI